MTVSYEKYDPDSEELTHQTFQKSALQPPKNKNCGIGATVSYLSHVKTLDDFDQYESMEEKGKPLKDLENQVKKLDDLDQYENYTHSPIPALPTKKRAMTVPKSGKCSLIDEQNEPDCYENYDG